MTAKVKIEQEYQRRSIPCPHCGCVVTNVIDSRAGVKFTRRRRECEKCSQRFSTYELLDTAIDELKELRDFKARMTKILLDVQV